MTTSVDRSSGLFGENSNDSDPETNLINYYDFRLIFTLLNSSYNYYL